MNEIESFLSNIYKQNKFYFNRVKTHRIDNYLDITKYPILSKVEIQENRYEMFSNNFKMKYYVQDLIRHSTSGTSGMPINIYWDPTDYFHSTMAMWRKRKLYYNITPYSRKLSFANSYYSNEIILKKDEHELIINRQCVYDDKFKETLNNVINEYNPIWLYTQPSTLDKIVYRISHNDLSLPSSVCYIESVGEVLSDTLRYKLKGIFKGEVADMYGSEEMNTIAYECPYHKMHILTDNVFVECKCGDNIQEFGEGEAIITNLKNTAMPFIRYAQGDIIVKKPLKKICPCGSNDPVIEIIKGRVYESVTIFNGKELYPLLLLNIVNKVNNDLNDPINKFTFTYKVSTNMLYGYFEIYKKYMGWDNVIRDALLQELSKYKFYSLTMEMHIVNEIPNNKSEKYKILIIEG